MSGLVGKGTKSYRKKNVAESNIPAIGIKAIQWAHEPGVEATDPTYLWANGFNTPADFTDEFVGATPTTVARLTTGQFRNNLRVVSNLNGELIDFDTYVVTDDGITFRNDYTVEDNEYFTFHFDRGAVSGNRIVDARPLRASGEIDLSVIAADTPFNFDVGQFFKIAGSVVDSDDIDSQQIGNVQVFVNGILQFRNTGNTDAADVESDETDNIEGNYQEVNGSNNNNGDAGGVANAIRFNKKEDFPGVTEINVMVISTNLIVDNPESITLQDGIDGLSSEINAVETKANRKQIFNGQITGDFTAVEIGTDLFSFGVDKANENYTLDTFNVTITDEDSATTTSTAGTLSIVVESAPVNSVTYSTISTITITDTFTVGTPISATISASILDGQLVRIRPTSFKTTGGETQGSFHIEVSGTAS